MENDLLAITSAWMTALVQNLAHIMNSSSLTFFESINIVLISHVSILLKIVNY